MENTRAIELLKKAMANWCSSQNEEYSCSTNEDCYNCIKNTFSLNDEEIKEIGFVEE